MKAKKVLSLLLACVFSISVLAGCGQSEGTKESESQNDSIEEAVKDDESKVDEAEESKEVVFPLEEPMEVSVFCISGDVTLKLEETVIAKVQEKRTNVKLNVTNVGLTDGVEKRNVLLNTGEYPDVFIKGGFGEEAAEYGAEGILIPLEDLVKEYAPNLSALLDEQNGWDQLRAADGHIYTLPQVSSITYTNIPFHVNKVWLDNLGMDMPESLDDFYGVLKAFKEQDADGDGDSNNEIPYLATSDETTIENMLPYFGINYAGGSQAWALTEDRSELYYWPVSDIGKEFFAYMQKLHSEGLLYKECFATTYEQACALGTTGTSIGVVCDRLPQTTVGKYTEGGKAGEYEFLKPFEGCKYSSSSGIRPGGFAITDKCENPEVMIAWMDYLYSEEGGTIADMGLEGDHYTVDENGMWSFVPETEYGGIVKGAGTLSLGGGVRPCLDPDFYLTGGYMDLEADPTADYHSNLFKTLDENDGWYTPWPTYKLSEEETEDAAIIDANVDAYWRQYRADVVTGKVDLDSTWDDFVAKMNEMGLEDLVQIHNDAYSRYLGK